MSRRHAKRIRSNYPNASKPYRPWKPLTRARVLAEISTLKVGDYVGGWRFMMERWPSSLFRGDTYLTYHHYSSRQDRNRRQNTLNKIFQDLVISGVLYRIDSPCPGKSRHVVRRLPVDSDW